MTEYKSYRFVDGKLRWIIVDENGEIINRNPSKEELRCLEKEIYFKKKISNKYNDTNTCNRCGIDLGITTGSTCREYNKERNWTGKWACQSCYNKERYKNGNTNANLIKEMGDRRTNNLDPNSSQAKGDNFEELTRIWRSAVSTIPVENLNKKLDNYTTHIDHSRDSELGIIQTKGKFYDSYNKFWLFTGLEREWEKKFDREICYCASDDRKIIERLYIFPKEDIEGRTCIAIAKYNSIGQIYKYGWYEKYRIKDKKTIDTINEIWKKIIENRL